MAAMPGREIRSLFSSAFSVVSLDVIFMADSLDGELDFLEDMVGNKCEMETTRLARKWLENETGPDERVVNCCSRQIVQTTT